MDEKVKLIVKNSFNELRWAVGLVEVAKCLRGVYVVVVKITLSTLVRVRATQKNKNLNIENYKLFIDDRW